MKRTPNSFFFLKKKLFVHLDLSFVTSRQCSTKERCTTTSSFDRRDAIAHKTRSAGQQRTNGFEQSGARAAQQLLRRARCERVQQHGERFGSERSERGRAHELHRVREHEGTHRRHVERRSSNVALFSFASGANCSLQLGVARNSSLKRGTLTSSSDRVVCKNKSQLLKKNKQKKNIFNLNI